MKEKIKKVIKSPVFTIVLVISLTGLVLWLTLRNDFDKVMEMLRNAKVWMLLVIAGLMVFDRIIHGWGLKKECNVSCPDYKWSQGFVNSYTGSLFNNITPSASGGQFAQVYIFTRQGVPVSNAIGVLWLDFIIYQTTMSIFVLLLLILRFGYYFSHYSQFFIIVLFGFVVNTAVILNFSGPGLDVTAHRHHHRIRIKVFCPMQHLPALTVCNIGHCARIYDINVSF